MFDCILKINMGKTNAPKDIKSDIDNLFSKKKKPIKKPKEEKKQQERPKIVEKEKKQEIRKRTEEGFLIYNQEELNIGKGGDTELCPFDCDCCF